MMRWGAAALGCAAALVVPHPSEAHAGHSSRAPWDACIGRASGAACEWDDAAHYRYVGTCRRFSDALLCVRQQPVIAPGAVPPAPVPSPPAAPARPGWREYIGATAVVGALAAWKRRRG